MFCQFMSVAFEEKLLHFNISNCPFFHKTHKQTCRPVVAYITRSEYIYRVGKIVKMGCFTCKFLHSGKPSFFHSTRVRYVIYFTPC